MVSVKLAIITQFTINLMFIAVVHTNSGKLGDDLIKELNIEIKRLLEKEIKQEQCLNDIKLVFGGIRETDQNGNEIFPSNVEEMYDPREYAIIALRYLKKDRPIEGDSGFGETYFLAFRDHVGPGIHLKNANIFCGWQFNIQCNGQIGALGFDVKEKADIHLSIMKAIYELDQTDYSEKHQKAYLEHLTEHIEIVHFMKNPYEFCSDDSVLFYNIPEEDSYSTEIQMEEIRV